MQGPIYIIIMDVRLLHCFGYYRSDMYAMHVYYFLGKKCGHFAEIYNIKVHTFYRHFVRVICVYFTNFSCILLSAFSKILFSLRLMV